MTQQTAVKWLEDRLNNVKPTQFCSIETIKEWVEQAKQMEKEQIIESYCAGCADISKDNSIFPRETSYQYYNETYNK